MATQTEEEKYGFRSDTSLSDAEKSEYLRLAQKIDDWVAHLPTSVQLTITEMEQFTDLFFTNKCHPGFVDYCLNSVNQHRDTDCFWK